MHFESKLEGDYVHTVPLIWCWRVPSEGYLTAHGWVYDGCKVVRRSRDSLSGNDGGAHLGVLSSVSVAGLRAAVVSGEGSEARHYLVVDIWSQSIEDSELAL